MRISPPAPYDRCKPSSWIGCVVVATCTVEGVVGDAALLATVDVLAGSGVAGGAVVGVVVVGTADGDEVCVGVATGAAGATGTAVKLTLVDAREVLWSVVQ